MMIWMNQVEDGDEDGDEDCDDDELTNIMATATYYLSEKIPVFVQALPRSFVGIEQLSQDQNLKKLFDILPSASKW